ncbi:MAG TPA: toll/interleukin-1 receptor domain-containing protein [Vitreimonas sp.]|uniref:toll/interleukin-1 receptor domain-containing protein n=1 Tax=Vitreimonas sp. TaxID=3069702 RepID=UPI002D35E126|nr:toll/interleukin-1 receptor domain-containing protein [Vitreimonas sp.]HYD87954.1 toll/interleukin-1 receptor domain-containing protein [Vitreimonas sp.]
MTVFIAHAPADRSAAEALEKTIERRGQFSELDDGTVALRPVQQGDALVLLVSQALTFATARLRLEQRALDAWADGRLVVVKLDKGIAPVGLRDLPAVDASFEAQREFKWNEVADQVRDKIRPAPPQAPEAARSAPRLNKRLRANFRTDADEWRSIAAVALPVLALPGVLALAAAVSIWLANRIGPAPGGWPELRRGVGEFGARFGLGAGATEILFVLSILLTIGIVTYWITRLFKKPKAQASPAAPAEFEPDAPAPAKQGDSVFVSYARANEGAVLPVIEAAKQAGRKFWLDQHGLKPGDGWAGEIVRAIRGAGGVTVMCSQAAFESDHVKREIYLADRYKKKLLPVYLEAVEPPEDFEYFFAGVQRLNLFETPEPERPQAFISALGSN